VPSSLSVMVQRRQEVTRRLAAMTPIRATIFSRGLVVASAGRGGELVQVLRGLGQAFVPGSLLAGGVRGGVDQDPSHGELRIALAGPVRGWVSSSTR
jgi:hypothetical protein